MEELKLTPHDLDIPIPRFFQDDDNEKVHETRAIVGAYMDQYGLGEVEREETTPVEVQMPDMSLEEAIRIIQKNERGRQGRMRANMMKV